MIRAIDATKPLTSERGPSWTVRKQVGRGGEMKRLNDGGTHSVSSPSPLLDCHRLSEVGQTAGTFLMAFLRERPQRKPLAMSQYHSEGNNRNE